MTMVRPLYLSILVQVKEVWPFILSAVAKEILPQGSTVLVKETCLVSLSETGMAFALVSTCEGGVSSVPVSRCPNEGGVACVCTIPNQRSLHGFMSMKMMQIIYFGLYSHQNST